MKLISARFSSSTSRVVSFTLLFTVVTLFTGTFATVPQVPPADTTSINSNSPIAGELIIRYQPAAARILYNELRRLNGSLPGTLIGQRLGVAILKEATPDLREVYNRHGVWAADTIDAENGTYRLKTSLQADAFIMKADFMQSTRVMYAEPNYPVFAFREPNDPFYRRGDQWALAKIDAPDAWDITTGSDGITIAVIDSGVAALHQDLEGKVLTGLNFVVSPPTISTTDDEGHGTFAAGVAAANGNNNYGIAGVSWGAKILPIKVLNSQLTTSNALLAMGINYAAERNADILNLSLGTPDRSEAVHDAVMKAYKKGLVLVAASGNTDKQNQLTIPQYPAAFDEVISVGATTASDNPASFSVYGPSLSISAPGEGIFSLSWGKANGQIFGFDRGTSFSAPYVSGTVALMLSVNRALVPDQVKNILESTADFPPSQPTTQVVASGPTASPTLPFGNNSLTTPGVTTSNTIRTLAPVNTPTPTAGNPTTLVSPAGVINYNSRIGFGRLNTYKAVLAAQKGEFVQSRRGQVIVKVLGNINPRDVQITLTPGDNRVSDTDGRLIFANLPPGNYTLTATSPKYGLPSKQYPLPSYVFQILGTGGETQSFDFDLSIVDKILTSGDPVGAFAPVTENPQSAKDVMFFPDTGHTLRTPFLQFWEKYGGLMAFGYPVSEVLLENGVKVQYFERVVCELHPEFAGTPFEIQVRRLSSEKVESRKETAFAKVPPPEDSSIINGTTFYWAETGHTLSGPFLQHWKDKGGLITIGLPLSEPFIEDGITVQYFERQRLELHPELVNEGFEVLGTLIARDYAQTQGLLGK